MVLIRRRGLALLTAGVLALGTVGLFHSAQPTRADDPPADRPLSAESVSAAAAKAGARLTKKPIALPSGVLKGTSEVRARSITAFGAKPDDGRDDTAAFRRAFESQRLVDGRWVGESPDDYNGREKVLFLPAGQYDLSGPIGWTGCCVTLRGAGSGSTVLKLRNGTPEFGDPAKPVPLLRTEATNEAFRNNVLHLTVDTGKRNPGAVGIAYTASNHGVMRDVKVRSGDRKGVIGVDMRRPWPGPMMLQDVAVVGFNVGMAFAHPYHVTLERITLFRQRKVGFQAESTNLAIRQLRSVNSVPVWRPTLKTPGYPQLSTVTLLDSRLEGGAKGTAALDLKKTNAVLVRDVTTTGYAAAVRIGGRNVTGRTVSEYTNRRQKVGGGAARTLDLPVEEVPRPKDGPVRTWARASVPQYNDPGANIAAAFRKGRSTVYFTSEVYLLYHQLTVRVPANVTHVVGYGATINSDPNGRGGGGLKLIVEGGSRPLTIEGFGYGVTIDHRSSRPLVLKDGKYGYTSTAKAAGKLWFENVEVHGFTLRTGQRLWARQWNNESSDTKIVNEGGDLWVFGMKTERPSTVLRAVGGRSEFLGLLLYPSQPFTGDRDAKPAFDVTDGQFAAFYTANIFVDGRADEYTVHLRQRTGSRVDEVRPQDLRLGAHRVGLLRGR